MPSDGGSYSNKTRNLSYRGTGRKDVGRNLGSPSKVGTGESKRGNRSAKKLDTVSWS